MQMLEISISLSQTVVCDTGGNTIQAREFLFQNPCRNQRSAYGYRYRRIAPPLANDPRSAIRKFLEYLLGCGVCLFADGSTSLEQLVKRFGVIEKKTVVHHPGVVLPEGFLSFTGRR